MKRYRLVKTHWCSLRAAREELQKAGNWGIVDLFGGGFITNLIKHSKMDNASHLMENAKYDLKKFQKELRDVTINTDLSIDCGGFLTFADFFWDGVVADWLVQSKINDAKRQVDDAIAPGGADSQETEAVLKF